MVRLDMSEFSEPHSVSRLIGAPPGYVWETQSRGGMMDELLERVVMKISPKGCLGTISFHTSCVQSPSWY